MRAIKWIFATSSLLFGIAFAFTACHKQEDTGPVKHSQFITTDVALATASEATLNGVLSVGVEKVSDCGFVWSTAHDPVTGTANEKHLGVQTADQHLSSAITGLTPKTSYFFRTFIILPSGTVYGDELSFITLEGSAFNTSPASAVDRTSVTLNGVLALGSPPPTDLGFVWTIGVNPTLGGTGEVHLALPTSSGAVQSVVTSLTADTLYSFRTFITIAGVTTYGDELTFKTTASSQFRTKSATAIAFTDAVVSGDLRKRDDAVFDCGIVWSTSQNPTTSDGLKLYWGPQTSSHLLSHKLNGLQLNTTYYYRTFIITAGGILYGDELSFTTLPAPTWEVPGGFPGPERMAAVSFVIGSKAYVALGHNHDENDHIVYNSDMYEFDMVTATWTRKKDFPAGGRSGAIAFSIGDKGYVGTGGSKTTTEKDLWQYDPATDSWEQKTDFPFPVDAAVAFSLDGKGYVGTGTASDRFGFVKTFYAYDPLANTWTQKADFPGYTIDQAVAFSIGGYGYIGMGLREESWLGNPKQLWAYDPSSDSWVQKKDCPSEKSLDGSISFVIGTHAYVGLGWSGDTTIWNYDSEQDSWTNGGILPGQGRENGVAFSVGSKALVGCGAGGIFYKDFVEYTP